MTKEWYKANGYAVSTNLEQAVLDRAESDVFNAYVLPILPNAIQDDGSLDREIADIAFLLTAQRSLKVTRSGTKEKVNGGSTNADSWSILSENVKQAALAVNRLRAKENAVEGAKVDDICGIYFKTNFFYS